MKWKPFSLILSALGAAALLAWSQDSPPPPAPKSAEARVLPAPEEAVVRAQLLHASFHGVLEIMHRDFFRKGDGKAIPSESLKDVFARMREEWGVEMRWLASDETIMNVDNKARDAFDTAALQAVASGRRETWEVADGKLRYAGVIPLQNQCLKCHVPGRKTLEDRFAALEITMAIKPPPAK